MKNRIQQLLEQAIIQGISEAPEGQAVDLQSVYKTVTETLVALADRDGVVLRVTQYARVPLRMGNYETLVDVRAKQK